MNPGRIAPVQALAALGETFEGLTDVERLVLPYLYQLWRRPEQILSRFDWRYLTFLCGRGWGKSFAIATEINRRVEAGEAKSIGLMAPTEDRVEEVQIKFLIDVAPPWFKPERYLGGLRWPNGVVAEVHTPIAPEGSRSSNFDLVWLSEIIAWQHTTRLLAFKTITTACRIGAAQVICDTTSKGKNDVIDHLFERNASDPATYPIVRGTTFDNPLLGKKYLKAECAKYTGQEFGEEILGRKYSEAQGASWKQKWIDDRRLPAPPLRKARRIVAIDPAQVSHAGADETGMVVGDDDGEGHAHLVKDLSARYTPEEWGDAAVAECLAGAAGVVIEVNHMGDQAAFVIKSRAALVKTERFPRGLSIRILKDDGKPFPPHAPGIIYVREKWSRTNKVERASGPASESEAGHVHHCGPKENYTELERQLTTYVLGVGPSPNRLDAYAFLITELRNLGEQSKAPPVADAAQAAQAHAALRERLRAVGKNRRIGA